MRRLCTSFVLAALLLGASGARATVNWSWSFSQGTLNLAESRSIDVVLTNLSSSDESITMAYVDFASFGDFGILQDPVSGSYIVPSLWYYGRTPVAPGQTVVVESLQFFFDQGLPSAGFSQTVTPAMKIYGSGCTVSGCEISKLADTPLTLVYAPVPEPGAWSLWAVGLAALGAFIGRRRSAFAA